MIVKLAFILCEKYMNHINSYPSLTIIDDICGTSIGHFSLIGHQFVTINA